VIKRKKKKFTRKPYTASDIKLLKRIQDAGVSILKIPVPGSVGDWFR